MGNAEYIERVKTESVDRGNSNVLIPRHGKHMKHGVVEVDSLLGGVHGASGESVAKKIACSLIQNSEKGLVLYCD